MGDDHNEKEKIIISNYLFGYASFSRSCIILRYYITFELDSDKIGKLVPVSSDTFLL